MSFFLFCSFVHGWTMNMHVFVHSSASSISQIQELFLTPLSAAPELKQRLVTCVWKGLCSAFPSGQPHSHCAWVQDVSASSVAITLPNKLSFLFVSPTLIVWTLIHQLNFSMILIICLPSHTLPRHLNNLNDLSEAVIASLRSLISNSSPPAWH